jgi:hypothetical protein
MKNIYVHCDGGFGNRYNVLLSGLFLAKKFDLNPIVIWKENNWCGAGFHDLFDVEQMVYEDFNHLTFFNEHDTFNLIHENQFGQKLAFISPFSLNNLDVVRGYLTNHDKDIMFFTNLIPRWVDLNEVYRDIIPSLEFVPEICEEVENFKKTLPEEYYGVHIRKTDFLNEVNDDSVYEFVKSNTDKTFFICSDDEETERRFTELPNAFSYPKTSYVEKLVDGTWNDRIVDSTGNAHNFNVNRPKESVKQAIVDLLLLSYSNLVNTNLRSTFLQIALHFQKSRNFTK